MKKNMYDLGRIGEIPCSIQCRFKAPMLFGLRRLKVAIEALVNFYSHSINFYANYILLVFTPMNG